MNLTILVSDEDVLVALMNDPSVTAQRWANSAACRGLVSGDASPFFPDDDATPPSDALKLCGRCPVALHCLAAAMIFEADSPEDLRFGWWGGLSPDDRREVAVRIDVPPIRVNVELNDMPPAERALHLKARNFSIPSIAAELGCTERTIYRYLARAAA